MFCAIKRDFSVFAIAVCDSVLSKSVREIDSVDVNLERCGFTFDVPEDTKPSSELGTPTVKALRPLSATRDRLRLPQEDSVVKKVAPSSAIKELDEDIDEHHPSVIPRTDSHDTQFDLASEDATNTRGVPSRVPVVTKEMSFPVVKFKLVKDSIKGAMDYQDVKYVINKDKAKENITIKLTGRESSINCAVVAIYEAMNEVKEATIPLGKEVATLVQHDGGIKLQQQLKNQRIHAQVKVQSGTVHVYTIGDPAPIVTAIKDFFTSASIPAKVGSPPLSGSEWDLKKTQLELAKEVVIKEYKGSKGYLQLFGYKQAVNDAKTQIEFFVQGKKVELGIINIQYENVFRYLRDVKKDVFDSVKQHTP